MSKRGYKLQEFVAHSSNVNCLSIGKKACRLFLTGGDDCKVNLWAIGKPNSLMSLCGHTNAVESVAFDSAEVLVLAGASSGVIKLWDVEEAKMVRGLTGHRSNCTAMEFHPFGEFFASGSTDTNLKIWDIRKKGCIHTYKGHTRGISTIRFSPDGRWVVSGGNDNVVKVWDLTAGKLLHDFKFHENHIRSMDFHPLEFLLATGSADRTVKFWDLETFELIGSSRPEATGVRAIAFHPDGRTLFCGLEDSLKVYSWEPVICHDGVDMGWSTLADLCIHDGKLLGCSYYQSSVGVWVADASLIEPYGTNVKPQQKDSGDDEIEHQESRSSAKVGTTIRSTSIMRCASPDYETKDIKNIYVDSSWFLCTFILLSNSYTNMITHGPMQSTGSLMACTTGWNVYIQCSSDEAASGNPVSSQRVGTTNFAKVTQPLDFNDTPNLTLRRQGLVTETPDGLSGHVPSKSITQPKVVSRDSPDGKDSSRRESITFSRTKPGMLLRPAHSRRPSSTKYDVDRLSACAEIGVLSSAKSGSESLVDSFFNIKVAPEDGARNGCEDNHSSVKNVSVESEKVLPLQTPKTEKCDQTVSFREEINSVKFVNGVAVVPGRTRTLVEKFEKKRKIEQQNEEKSDRLNIVEQKATRMSSHMVTPEDRTPVTLVGSTEDQSTVMAPQRELPADESSKTPPLPVEDLEIHHGSNVSEDKATILSSQTVSEEDSKRSTLIRNFRRRDRFKSTEGRSPVMATQRKLPTDESGKTSSLPMEDLEIKGGLNVSEDKATSFSSRAPPREDRAHSALVRNVRKRDKFKSTNDTITVMVHQRGLLTDEATSNDHERGTSICGSESDSVNHEDVTELLLGNHEVFLSTLRSRLTKLQVVRHFFERKDMKGAINALRRLPDHSVQADVISILTEKMEMLNLDLFSCLLPVLVGLLDSKVERHSCVSLEMLLKLVAVFGSVVRSTVSAPPTVGVDLHAEQRLECCNQCFTELQKIQKIIPMLVR
ncbi:LOW QUALITY PROTEIN: katanin p80 WD40 repeat-containing subunit B1 homolog KTN80.1 [Eucalyptus grandis]|uniref:LOW QUALITY PROTEIN: katanin p80 WD40 repeat-containing subunit B1 homolog KTN80.1 n=1 Tax=Eucalyptus grandis TaxID=71139 RepID=UPI00192EC60D|nr:LOW QUALITY PROTEIN: katanin p80 WD40 repeat-containing subunit B1 homolog KTN80.1 [Eucalyptus grandis]